MAVNYDRRLKSKVKKKIFVSALAPYRQKERKYVLIRAKHGGTTRVVKVKGNCTVKEMLEILVKLFCPNMKTSFGFRILRTPSFFYMNAITCAKILSHCKAFADV